MTPPKAKYDIGKTPFEMGERDFNIWRLGILTMMLAAIESGDIEKPPGLYMQAFVNEHKARTAWLKNNPAMQ